MCQILVKVTGSRYLPSQYNEVKHYARFSGCRSYIWRDIEHQRKMCQSHWSAKYRSRSPGQGTYRVSTSRRSTIQGLVVEGLIVADIWKGDLKGVKVNGTQNIGQDHRVKIPAVRTLRRSTMQGLVVVGLIVEKILNINVKCVKGTGAQNKGQGYQVKIPAESVHLGEALCKVWWLEVLHEEICNTDVNYVSHSSQNIGQFHQVKVSAKSVYWEALCKVWWL